MPGRNSELIRQWTILRELATTRTNTIPKLATQVGVTTRTVRRDLDALQAAGFPIAESEVNGSKFWRLPEKAMAGLERTGLTFGELSALYLSRALFECFAESHLLADLSGALNKVDSALSPAMRKFLDRLPRALSAKSPHAKKQAAHTHALQSWILGFGHGIRVIGPASLVEWAMEELDRAREQYSPGDVARALESSLQPGLPFVFSRLATDAN